jgi:hypothetical protein
MNESPPSPLENAANLQPPKTQSFPRRLCSWRVMRVLLFVLICLVTLAFLINAEENWRAQRAWMKCRRALEAKGEKLDLAAFVPAPVPSDKNFATTPLLAGALAHGADTNPVSLDFQGQADRAPRRGNWRLGRLTEWAAWRDYLQGNPLPTPAPAADTVGATPRAGESAAAVGVLQALSRYDAQIAELRAASHLLYAQFPVRWNHDPVNQLLPHLSLAKGLCQTLSVRACAALSAGKSDEALADTQVNYRLMSALRDEPLVISHLVRIAMNEITAQSLWEGLAARRWSEPQLEVLEKELASLDFIADEVRVLRGERASVNATCDRLVRSRSELQEGVESLQANPAQKKAASFALLMLFPRWLIRHSQILINEYEQEIINTLQQAQQQPQAHSPLDKALVESWQQRLARTTPCNLLARQLIPVLFKLTNKSCNAQTTVNLARLAVALERHRLANGSYPEKLDALAPRFLEKIPLDVFDGKPLRYRLQSDGTFLLYSIGVNQTDDSGKVVLRESGGLNLEEGDWVWSYAG